MKIPNISGIVGAVKTIAASRRPELLLAGSIVGTVTTAVLAAKGGYDARGILEAHDDNIEDIPVKEKIQLTWLCYIPATIAATGGIGSTAGLHLTHVKDKKALAQSLALATAEVQRTGQQLISDNVAEIRKSGDGVKVENSDGEIEELYLVRDAFTGRDIWSNKQRIEDAVIEANKAIMRDYDEGIELNTFYALAGYGTPNDLEDYGWSGETIELKWGATVRDDGRAATQFTFRTKPKEGYNNHH